MSTGCFMKLTGMLVDVVWYWIQEKAERLGSKGPCQDHCPHMKAELWKPLCFSESRSESRKDVLARLLKAVHPVSKKEIIFHLNWQLYGFQQTGQYILTVFRTAFNGFQKNTSFSEAWSSVCPRFPQMWFGYVICHTLSTLNTSWGQSGACYFSTLRLM